MLKFIHMFLILLMSLLQEPVREAADPGYRVVTQVQVSVTHAGETESRCCTDADEMEQVLNYLRLLDPKVRAEIAPETFRADTYEIVISYSDGSRTTYRQLYDDYLQKDGGAWMKIEPKDDLLFSIL